MSYYEVSRNRRKAQARKESVQTVFGILGLFVLVVVGIGLVFLAGAAGMASDSPEGQAAVARLFSQIASLWG